MDSESDEDMKRAIALSLRISPQKSGVGKPLVPGRSTTSISNDPRRDEDKELKAALDLSPEIVFPKGLQRPKSYTPVIDLTSDDEDDDLDAPVTVYAASTQHSARQASSGPDPTIINNMRTEEPIIGKRVPLPLLIDQGPAFEGPRSTIQPQPTPLEGSEGSGLFGLNRKQMEEERLARASQKRKREEESVAGPNHPRKRNLSGSSMSRYQEPLQVKTNLSEKLNSLDRAGSNYDSCRPNSSTNKPGDGLQVIDLEEQSDTSERLAQNPKLKETRSDIAGTAEDPLKRKDKALEVLSNQDHKTPRVTGVQYLDGVVKRTWAYGFPRESDDIKFEEVIQKADLELAVMSAFQIDPEWVASKLDPKTNVIWVLQAKTEAETCFIIDLPRLADGMKIKPEHLTHFGKEFLYFAEAIGLGQSIIESMARFDFSRTKRLGFVHSIGGSHTGANWKRTGYCGLGTTVQKLGLNTEESVDVDFVASSIGSLNDSFIKSMYLASKGNDGLTEYRWRTNKPTNGKSVSEAEKKLSEEIQHRFRIYFPTHETVAQSKGGTESAGTICFQAKWYDAVGFPRSLMRDCKSQREGMLMHNKMMFVRHQNPNSRGDVAWAYIGSANVSESAWGRLVKDKATKLPKLNCRNWECGVLFPLQSQRQHKKSNDRNLSNHGPPGMKVFDGHVTVPMLIPGTEYGMRRPWFFSEQSGP